MAQFKRRWMAFVYAFGRVQTTIILFLIYVLVIGPASLCLWMTRRRDLLDVKNQSGRAAWTPKPRIPTDIKRCERQF